MPNPTYIHGTEPSEQSRLTALNRLTNPPFIEFLKPGPTDRILEIGSGLGLLAADLARRFPRCTVTGLEFSPDQLAHAPTSIPNLSFTRGDAHHLPFDDASFDRVYCRYVLEHVADPARVLSEALRTLKPGGFFRAQENDISLVRHDPPTPAFDLVWDRFARLQSELGGDAFIGRRLFGLLARAGFTNLSLSFAPEVYWAGHPAFEPWIQNLIGNIRSGQAALHDRSLATPAQTDAAIAELSAMILNPSASTWFAWNRAAASKPGA